MILFRFRIHKFMSTTNLDGTPQSCRWIMRAKERKLSSFIHPNVILNIVWLFNFLLWKFSSFLKKSIQSNLGVWKVEIFFKTSYVSYFVFHMQNNMRMSKWWHNVKVFKVLLAKVSLLIGPIEVSDQRVKVSVRYCLSSWQSNLIKYIFFHMDFLIISSDSINEKVLMISVHH